MCAYNWQEMRQSYLWTRVRKFHSIQMSPRVSSSALGLTWRNNSKFPYCVLLFSPQNCRRRLCDATKPGSCATDTQQARAQQRSNLLIRRIEAWQQVQVLFMPSVSTLRSDWSESMNRPSPWRIFLYSFRHKSKAELRVCTYST